jgi:hypothetical protein
MWRGYRRHFRPYRMFGRGMGWGRGGYGFGYGRPRGGCCCLPMLLLFLLPFAIFAALFVHFI